MWSRFTHGESMVGPNFATQKRDFSYNLSNVVIAPGKSFQNPNFVNNRYPNVHSPHNNLPYMPNHNICHTPVDIPEAAPETVTQKTFNENSSQNTVELIQEHCNSPIQKIPVNNKQMCHTRKRCKKNKSRKKKEPNKNSKEHNFKKQIRDMMEIDFEPDISINSCDSNLSSIPSFTSPTTVHLTDYIVDLSSTPNKLDESEDDATFTFISITPPQNNKMFSRERQLSMCESEDSFIVFDSGTDEELNFSDNSPDSTETESDDEEDDSDSDCEADNDFDSSYSVVPCKKVRFAENEELCEIHPMVQWSFAYRNARKGPWEEYARDRHRFTKRIQETEKVLSPIFDLKHRENVYKERFEDRF